MSKAEELRERLLQRAKPIRERLSAPTATDLRESYDSMLTEAAAYIRKQDEAIKLALEALDSQKLDVITRLQHHENIRADDDQYEDPEEWALRDALKELNTAINKLREVQG